MCERTEIYSEKVGPRTKPPFDKTLKKNMPALRSARLLGITLEAVATAIWNGTSW